MSPSLLHVSLAISAALLDSIWEGALVVGAVWLVARCLPALGSASRYAIWLCTLVALIAIPVFTVLKPASVPEPNAAPTSAAKLQPPPPALGILPAARPRMRIQPVAGTPQTIVAEHAGVSARTLQQIFIPQMLVLAIALLWVIVTCGRLFRLALDFLELATIRRQSVAWRNVHDFPIHISARVHVPIAVGFLRPAVILPRTIVEEVDHDALQAILVHETAHLRRYDVWTNAVAQIIEAVIVLNPVSWFVARQIVAQREIACDDWVVAQTDSSESFARALAAMADRVRGRVPAGAPGAIGSSHTLVERIAHLMDHQRPRRLRSSGATVVSALALLTLIGFTLQAVSPALAFTPQTGSAVQHVAVNATDCHARDYPPILRRTSGPGSDGMGHLSSSDRMLQKFTALRLPGILTYQVNVDATGHPHDFKILHSSNDPALDTALETSVMNGNFAPANHACEAVAGTFKSGIVRLPRPVLRSSALRYRILPEPGGAPRTCAVSTRPPYIVRKVEPQIPGWLNKLADQRSFESVVKVHVDASGQLSDAARYALETPPDTAQKAFDEITVATAKHYVYAGGVRNCTRYSSAYLITTTLTKWLAP